MFVVEEMGNLNKDWNSFMILEKIPRYLKGDILYLLRNKDFIV
jgi:hypothetical protein